MSYKKERAAVSAALFFLVVVLVSCQSPEENLTSIAQGSKLNQEQAFTTPFFTLLGRGHNNHTAHVNIYIEGDGQAWHDPWTISEDPSPYDPVGFRLALVDSRKDSILYLSRPCQFIKDKRCSPVDWTSGRFSQKVIDTYHDVLNQIKDNWKAKTFTLHGYSGGTTIALLIAGQRKDISAVITFAPLLDPDRWAVYHQYSPLTNSLTPLSFASNLKQIPQSHFIGLEDQQVPLCTSTNYFAVIPESPHIKIHKIPHFDHHSDWPEFWKSYILTNK